MKYTEMYESRYHSWHLSEDLIDSFIIFTEFSSDISEWSKFI
jgi:hypothetical protein